MPELGKNQTGVFPGSWLWGKDGIRRTNVNAGDSMRTKGKMALVIQNTGLAVISC